MRENNFRPSPTADRSTPAAPTPPPPKLAFVCTGMGPQWWKMCRGLLDVFPAFTDSIQRSDRELSRYTDWSLLDELRRDEAVLAWRRRRSRNRPTSPFRSRWPSNSSSSAYDRMP